MHWREMNRRFRIPSLGVRIAALRRRTRLFLVAAACALSMSVAFLVAVAIPLDHEPYLAAEPSPEMTDRNGKALYAFLNDNEQWSFVRNLDELGPRIVNATLAAEDQRFYSHFGVDPVAVVRAVLQNVAHAGVRSGGSTLTMQVVKMHENTRRSMLGKALQAMHAMRLERRADKASILNAYLNVAPYGLNLIGAEAASRRYFGKPARELTISEAALIAALPKAPSRLMPLEHPERALARRNYVLARMRDDGYITEAECKSAIAEPVCAQWHEFPALAPHIAMNLRPRIVAERRTTLSLDAGAQENAERTVAHCMKRYRGDIGNAAAIVVDVASAAVLARVGSAAFYDTPGGGQVDSCRALRAPGSALKPFTYALAMEQSVLYASEALLDDSIDYGAYSPKNYDGDYNGLMPAGDALRHSLNVPAVMILDRIGVEPLAALLQNAGLTTLTRSPKEYGLGLTLGDCEVRLDELAGAYCMLANLGEFRPLKIEAETPTNPEPKRLFSKGTCLKLFEMLEQTLPDELEPNLIRANTAPRVCWKTGTSTGHHDAWAFVFNRQYVVGVWMGNNDGRASERLVGMQSALPLAARIFRSLPVSETATSPDAGCELKRTRICAITGLPASQWCTRTKEESLPRDQYVNRICDVHCPSGERWPGSPKAWNLAKVNAPVPTDPNSTQTQVRKAGLLIREPANLGEYVLTGEPEGDRIRLKTSLDAETTLNWFLDDAFLGASSPEKPLLMDLKPGSHTLACMTSDGALDKISFDVTEPEIGRRLFKQ